MPFRSFNVIFLITLLHYYLQCIKVWMRTMTTRPESLHDVHVYRAGKQLHTTAQTMGGEALACLRSKSRLWVLWSTKSPSLYWTWRPASTVQMWQHPWVAMNNSGWPTTWWVRLSSVPSCFSILLTSWRKCFWIISVVKLQLPNSLDRQGIASHLYIVHERLFSGVLLHTLMLCLRTVSVAP